MTNTLTQTPIRFSTNMNLIPHTLSELTDTTPFTASNCTKSIQTATTIDGYSLKRLRLVPSW